MKKVTKLLSVLVLAGAISGVGGALAGCKGNPHTHSYIYKSDGAAGHHQECKDGDDVRDEKFPHNFNTENKCSDCGYEKPDDVQHGEKLGAPTLTLSVDTITWTKVNNAVGYTIYDGDVELAYVDAEEDVFSIDLSMRQLSIGKHVITVVAKGDGVNYSDSDHSNSVEYTFNPGGGDVTAEKLGAPTLTLSGTTITWTKIDNAVGYTIYDGDVELAHVDAEEDVFSIDLSMRQLSIGKHVITVVANGDGVNYTDSDHSNSVEYTFNPGGGDVTAEKLDAPTNLQINDGVLTWTGNSNASSYDVYKDDTLVTNVKTASYTLPTDLPAGDYYYSVLAKGDGTNYTDSDKSDPVKYTVQSSGGGEVEYDYVETNVDFVAAAHDINASATGDVVIPEGNYTYGGKVTFVATGKSKFEVGKKCFNTQGSSETIIITLSGISNTLTIKGTGASGNFTGYTIKKDGETFKTENISGGNSAVISIELTDLPAGTYTFTSLGGAARITEIKLVEKLEKSEATGISVTALTLDFLKGEDFSSNGLTVTLNYANGRKDTLESSKYTVDSDAFDNTKAGKYTITVKYKDNESFTATYSVYVYTIDTLELSLIDYNSKDGQLTVQQAVLKNGTLSTDYLTVFGTGAVDGRTHTFKLSADVLDITKPDVSSTGEKNVTVTLKNEYATSSDTALSAIYKVVVLDTMTASDNKLEINVGGENDIKTLTQAIQYLKALNLKEDVEKVINLEAGKYEEKVIIDVPHVALIGKGADKDKTIITYSLVEGDASASGTLWGLSCATVQVNAIGFTAKNLSIRNDFDYIKNNKNYSGNQGPQGLALTINADKAELVNVHLYGNQDTLYIKTGRTHFKDGLIEGNIDYIFGEATGIAFFDNSEIKTISKTASETPESNAGYVTAMKADANTKPDYGYVFNNCRFTDDGKLANGSVSLGRPWGVKATVTMINCSFTAAYSTVAYGTTGSDGKEVKPRWYSMSGNSPEDADFAEYGSTGAGAITESVKGGTVLTKEKADLYTLENTFAMKNGKCTWKTPWAGTNTKAILKVIDADYVGDGDGVVYESYLEVGIKLTEELAKQMFVVEDKVLVGLYLNKECSLVFDYSTPLPDNGATLYAKFEDADQTVKEYYSYSYSNGDTAPAKVGKVTFSGLAENGDWLIFSDDNASVTFKGVKGSVITINAYQNSVLTFNGDEVEVGETSGKITYTVKEDGDVVIKRKTQTASYLNSIEIKVPISESTTIDLLEYDGTVEGSKAMWKGIEIDATSGKFAKRTTDIQVNSGLVLKFLVSSDEAEIKVVDYNGNDDKANWTIVVENGVATLTATGNTYIKAIEVTIPVVTPPTAKKEATITVASNYGSVSGDSDITFEYYSVAGKDNDHSKSPNAKDFKFDDNNTYVTVKIAGLKKGQTVSLTVSGYTGSTNKDVGLKIGTLTNAAAAANSPEKVLFDKTTTIDSLGSGTFTFTVSEDGDVAIQLLRSEGNTTRLSQIDVVAE